MQRVRMTLEQGSCKNTGNKELVDKPHKDN